MELRRWKDHSICSVSKEQAGAEQWIAAEAENSWSVPSCVLDASRMVEMLVVRRG